MKNHILLLSMLLAACAGRTDKTETNAAANKNADSLAFTVIYEIPIPSVPSRQIGGTCWAFSTTSFLEAEIYRMKGEFVNLSAMYFVRNAYLQKAQNYILRQGTARFTEGGCNYDPLIDIDRWGLLPQDAYSGLAVGTATGDHGKMVGELSSWVTEFASPGNKLGAVWKTEIPAILDTYMGKPSDTFHYAGSVYSPTDFLKYTGLKADDYINLTTFSHAPEDGYFILQIPANWANTHYFNVSLDEYMANIDNALQNGYSLAIDVDLMEPGVSFNKEIAFLPEGDSIITPQKRQLDFESFATTDDHNMHLVSKVKDQHGNVYYKCKNSWGDSGYMKEYFYLSEPHVRLRSIYVMLHKDGLLKTTREKVNSAKAL